MTAADPGRWSLPPLPTAGHGGEVTSDELPSREPAHPARDGDGADPAANPVTSYVRSELRAAARWLLNAVAYAGVFWGGAPDIEEALMEIRPIGRRPMSSAERRFQREVARGIADLEHMLDRESHR